MNCHFQANLPTILILGVLALTFPPVVVAKYDLDAGVGYSGSSAPSFITRDSNAAQIEKAVGTGFSGFHVMTSIGIPFKQWLTGQATLSASWEFGEANHPATDWTETQSELDLTIPSGAERAKRKTYNLLVGALVQNRESTLWINPWTSFVVGWSVKYLDIERFDSIYRDIFYPLAYQEEGVIQSGVSLGLGLGADMRVWRKLEFRFGLEYQPIFPFQETVLFINVGKGFNGNFYRSQQEVDLVGDVIHQWRILAGPRWEF
jgi:hypothetical protein